MFFILVFVFFLIFFNFYFFNVQVFPVLWQLLQGDMATMWEVAPLFHRRCRSEVILSSPLEVRLCISCVARTD